MRSAHEEIETANAECMHVGRIGEMVAAAEMRRLAAKSAFALRWAQSAVQSPRADTSVTGAFFVSPRMSLQYALYLSDLACYNSYMTTRTAS